MRGVFGFDSALLILKAGGRVKRLAWPANQWLRVDKQDLTHMNIQVRDIVASLPDGTEMEYAISTYDLLAGDWTAECTTDLPKETDG